VDACGGEHKIKMSADNSNDRVVRGGRNKRVTQWVIPDLYTHTHT